MGTVRIEHIQLRCCSFFFMLTFHKSFSWLALGNQIPSQRLQIHRDQTEEDSEERAMEPSQGSARLGVVSWRAGEAEISGGL